jgi:hypothetical protein
MSNFQLFRNSVRATPSSGGGTQSDELQAKIKSVTSSTTVGAVFVYDTRNDSDPSWRSRCQGLSWFDEDLNTSTRGGRREFPSVALLVVDNASGAGGITVYDLDDPSIPMFMVFSKSGTSVNSQSLCSTDDQISCVYALNGRIYFGTSSGGDYYGLRQCDLTTDTYSIYNYGAGERVSPSSDRNAVHDWMAIPANAAKKIASNTVNDVAAKIVEGAEIGALGLPIPTIACALANKISVIHPNGTVVDLSDSSATRAFVNVAWRDDGSVVGYNSSNGAYQSFRLGSIYADTIFNDFRYENGSATHIPNPITNAVSTSIAYGNGKLYGGNSAGLTIFNENKGNPAESLFAYIDSDYNTGYMLGDIRFAGLANVLLNDRSVKANTLTQNGSITSAFVATDAELKAYSGWSASNYVSRAYDADFDFGTGDFSVMFWCNLSTSSNTEAIVARYAPDSASPDWLIAKQNDTDKIRFLVDGTNAAITANGIAGRWAQVCVLRRGSTVEIYVDGKLDGSGTNSANLTNTSAVLGIGIIPTSSVSNPLASTSNSPSFA